MKNARPEDENIMKDVKILFRWEKLKKETTDTTIKYKRNRFRVEKENKALKTE